LAARFEGVTLAGWRLGLPAVFYVAAVGGDVVRPQIRRPPYGQFVPSFVPGGFEEDHLIYCSLLWEPARRSDTGPYGCTGCYCSRSISALLSPEVAPLANGRRVQTIFYE
jgi:hypothetical protein